MSGGHFGYEQYKIAYIADDIEQEIIKSGKPIPENKQDRWMKDHPEECVNFEWPEPVLRKMEEAIYALKRAQIYAQRVDYLLCSDDGIDSFHKRLEEELAEFDASAKKGDNGVMYIPIDRNKDPYEYD